MSSVNYVPLQEENSANAQPSTTTPAQPTQAELCLIRRSARFVYLLAFVQMVMGFFAMLAGGVIVMVITAIFTSMGIVGACRRRPRFLIAHFVYSLVLYIFTLIGIVAMIIYCHHCTLWGFVFGFVLLVIQAIGMRHLRVMIGYARLYPNAQCNWSRRCANRCNNQTQTQTENNHVAVQVEAQPQSQPEQTPVQAPQVPQPIAPQFYPAPQVVAVPQQYMAMANYQPVRYIPQQGYPMMPMGVQPYMVYPQPPQDGSAQPLYPTVPGVYRQN
jgi:hypothetical protein